MIEVKGTEPSPTEIAEVEALVRRVTAAPQISGSPKLREFFLYVMDCYIRQAPEEATEQHIGIHVFGRRPGFNSSDDSIVRSQARLLRMKLTVYFASEGADEPVVIEIPKGHYFPVLRRHRADEPSLAHDAVAIPHPDAEEEASSIVVSVAVPRVKRSWLVWLGLALSSLIGIAAGVAIDRRVSSPPPSALDRLWSPFLAAASPTLVIYSNPAFTGTPHTGLRLTDGDGKQTAELDETYTGTGEVAAIYELTRLFDRRQASFTLKRSRLVTWDEAKSRNLIFIGAPSQNTALQELPTATEFAVVIDEHEHGYFVNRHPHAGEPGRLPYADATQETALIALLPGLQPDRRILVFSGLTTIGTEAAVEFACQPGNVAKLLEQAGSAGGAMKPFEAILRVSVSKGVGVGAEIVSLHGR